MKLLEIYKKYGYHISEDENKYLEEFDKRYEVYNYKHALAILKEDFYSEWLEILKILSSFDLLATAILKAGGRKSPISTAIDQEFYRLNWLEKQFKVDVNIDEMKHETPTHQIDCYKNRIAFEIEWNNKDPFYDRDLNNFRLLHDLDVISVGVIFTRSSELQDIFKQLGKGDSYGTSTTHINKLLPRIEGRGNGGCPVLVIGITKNCFIDDR